MSAKTLWGLGVQQGGCQGRRVGTRGSGLWIPSRRKSKFWSHSAGGWTGRDTWGGHCVLIPRQAT